MPLVVTNRNQVLDWANTWISTHEDITTPSYASNSMGLPTYTAPNISHSDEGDLDLDVSTSDLWMLNAVLTHLPMICNQFSKTLRCQAHYPNHGKLSVSFSHAVPVPNTSPIQMTQEPILLNTSQQQVFLELLQPIIDRPSILLLDCRFCKTNSDGYRYPKAWLWDIHLAVARELDPQYTGPDPTRSTVSRILVDQGRIYYVRPPEVGPEFLYQGPNGEKYPEYRLMDCLRLYIEKIEDLLEAFYDRGICGIHAAGSWPSRPSAYEGLVIAETLPNVNAVRDLYS